MDFDELFLGSEVCRIFLGPEEPYRGGEHFKKMADHPEEIIAMWHEVVQSYAEDYGDDEQFM